MATLYNPKDPPIPTGLTGIYGNIQEWSVWYSGSIERITNYYSGLVNGFGMSSRNGSFWGRDYITKRRDVTHVPIAGDISATSASMLFSEHPKVKAVDENAQPRLNEIIDRNALWASLLEAAELSSAMGGVYTKLNWDPKLVDYPIISVAQPDTAWFYSKWGVVNEIVFCKEIEEDDRYVWRLFEHHTPGFIENVLYRGNESNIGVRVPLEQLIATRDLLDEIPTGLVGLTAWYIPNIKPNRMFPGSLYGQSDYAGSESLMDSLDETYTSLMRDIKIGKGRITVPDLWLTRRNGEMQFDTEEDVYSPVRMVADEASKAGATVSQFAIRSEEHISTSEHIIRTIVSNAGYAPQSFGIDINGQAESGTALNIKERKSFITTAKKAAYWDRMLTEMLEAALVIDREQLGHRDTMVCPVDVEMQHGVRGDMASIVDSVAKLSTAKAASKDTMVRMLHDDFSEEQIMDEVAKIMAEESGLAMPLNMDVQPE